MPNTELKHCPICKKDKTLDAFQQYPDGRIRKHVCKACYGLKYRSSIRLEAILALGSKCACCGEDHPMFLCLDHISNDGGEHRAQYTSSNNSLIYADARKEGWPEDKYQLLCYNCNSAKQYNGICPHQEGLTAEDALAEMRGNIFKTGKTLQNMNLEPLKLGPKVQHKRALDPMEMALHLFSKLSPEDVKNLMERFKAQGP